MKISFQVEMNRPRWTQRLPKWVTRSLIVLAVLFAAALPMGLLASDKFADVPTGALFHDQIGAIADAGITTGCGGGNYCPDDVVSRRAMAAFMHRGYGRVHLSGLTSTALSTVETPAVWTTTITPGLPAGALAGATGFIKADATITVQLTDATGCPCRYRGALFMTGDGYMLDFYTDVTLDAVGDRAVLAMTGAEDVTTSGAKTVEIRLFRAAGSGAATGYGNVTTTYFPFGGTGGSVLSLDSQDASGPSATPR